MSKLARKFLCLQRSNESFQSGKIEKIKNVLNSKLES
jgi:hypothetical protein